MLAVMMQTISLPNNFKAVNRTEFQQFFPLEPQSIVV